MSPLFRWGNCDLEPLSHQPKVSQLVSSLAPGGVAPARPSPAADPLWVFWQLYHACDGPGLWVLCFIRHDTLEYFSVYGTALSMWVSLMGEWRPFRAGLQTGPHFPHRPRLPSPLPAHPHSSCLRTCPLS